MANYNFTYDSGQLIYCDPDGNVLYLPNAEVIAVAFSKDESYSAGDLVTYNGKLFEAKDSISSGSDFDVDDWKATTISEVIAAL